MTVLVQFSLLSECYVRAVFWLPFLLLCRPKRGLKRNNQTQKGWEKAGSAFLGLVSPQEWLPEVPFQVYLGETGESHKWELGMR